MPIRTTQLDEESKRLPSSGAPLALLALLEVVFANGFIGHICRHSAGQPVLGLGFS